MCSTFNQNLQRQDLSRLIENILGLSDVSFSKSKIFPGKPALALKSDESHKNVCAEMMRFSLIPRWAKEPKLKFATHNARLETVLEKATWKDAFSHRHCLIPISGFIEPIYEGSLGGNMVEFQAKEGILFAAGIWEEWNNKVDGEVITSFSILTSDPYPFVKKAGHDRSPIFLNNKEAVYWLDSTNEKPQSWIPYLLKHRLEPVLETAIDRPLKSKS